MKSYMAETKRLIMSLTDPKTFYQSIRDYLWNLNWDYEDWQIKELQRLADWRYGQIGGNA